MGRDRSGSILIRHFVDWPRTAGLTIAAVIERLVVEGRAVSTPIGGQSENNP